MYTHLFIVILNTSSCFCYAGYELFQGFYVTDVDDTSDATTDMFLNHIYDRDSNTSQVTVQNPQNATAFVQGDHVTTEARAINTTTKSKFNRSETESLPNISMDLIEAITLRSTKFDCPEEEKPSNIGPYEIPTQRDMVLLTRNILLEMFNSYNKQAFYLLKDIREATKAASGSEKQCEGNKMAYRKCVKITSRKCQQITKTLVRRLETRKQKISDLTKVQICNLSQMTTDPIELLKSLAQEKVSLEFALPEFLRSLSACSLYCIRSASASNYYKNKPGRHMTDQDLVIKHFLTRKNYLELIMDSRHKSKANSN